MIPTISDDGVIFVSIDHNEEHHLRMLLDEIFGDSNYRNTFVVSRVKKNIREREKIRALNFGYNLIIFYAKSDCGLIVPVTKPRKKPKNDWHDFDAPGVRPTMSYELFGMVPPETRHWMYAEERAQEMIRTGKLRRNKKSGKPEYRPDKKYMMLDTNWTDIQESSSKFNFPNGEKNTALVRRLISMVDDKEAIILDSFAGTGTTAEAVIQANENDGGSRKFILVELEPEISRNTTFRRLSDAVKRSTNNGRAKTSGFAYCTLDNELFDCNGAINPRCTFEQIARYVFFTETRKPLELKIISDPFLGKSDGTEYYLFFNTMRKSSTLDFETLKALPKETKKVVYADLCRVSEARLKKYNVTFKQTPYDLDVDAL